MAYAMAVVCCAAGLVLGFWVARDLGTVLSVYLILQLLYTQFLKHQPIIDLAMVASGFLLRMMAGGAATHIPLSAWFLLVAAFGSLFMVAGKRYSELVVLGADAGTRKSLKAYTVSYLRFAWHLSAAITVMSYCLWAIGGPLPPRGGSRSAPAGCGGACPGPRCRSFPSSSACCSTPWRWIVATPGGSRRMWSSTTGRCRSRGGCSGCCVSWPCSSDPGSRLRMRAAR